MRVDTARLVLVASRPRMGSKYLVLVGFSERVGSRFGASYAPGASILDFRSIAFLSLLVGLGAGCPSPKIDRHKSQTRVELAYDALRANELDIAEKEASAALGYNPKNEVAHNVLGLADQLRAARAGLLIEFDDCLEGLDAEVIQTERDKALLSADRHFADAIKLSPDYGEAFANRGNVALQMRDFEAASGFLKTALEFHGRLQSTGATRAHLGWAHFQQGEYPQAAKELRQALQFSPELCIALYRLGRVYFARQEWNNAEERFTAVTNLPRCQMQEAYLYLSKTQAAIGRGSDAQASAQKCVSLAPKSCASRQCTEVAQAGFAQPTEQPEGDSSSR